jgi:hypothetical protein
MRTIFLVQPDEAESARKMEQILLALPEDTGILFVSASVIPDPLSKEPRKALYRVVIGCSRARDIGLIELVARTYLRQEIQHESQLTIEVHRGIDRRSLCS